MEKLQSKAKSLRLRLWIYHAGACPLQTFPAAQGEEKAASQKLRRGLPRSWGQGQNHGNFGLSGDRPFLVAAEAEILKFKGGVHMEQPALLEMRGISKEFPGVKALDNVQLTVRPGTVHALMGENGA